MLNQQNNTLSVRVSSRKNDQGSSFFEGTVSIQGLKPTKLVKKSDGSSQFPTKSAVSGAARNLAKSLGFNDVDITDTTAPKQAAKKAAKKSSTGVATKQNTASATANTKSK